MRYVLACFMLGVCRAKVLDFVETPPFKYECRYCQPEQIHISFGEKPNDIVVTWSTGNDTSESRAQYGAGGLDEEAGGARWLFTDGGALGRQQWIHRVVMKNLSFNTTYVYHVGSEYGWSERLHFRTPPAGEDWEVRAAIYGDLGMANAHSLPYLQSDAEAGLYDVVVHVGDFAYDLAGDDSLVGDQFMRQIQPVAATVPYMTCPGNHEEAYNFSNYKSRFSMPGEHASMFYSWDLGPIHFVAFSTEAYYNFTTWGFQQIKNQLKWLRADLTEAAKPENREKRPWIIMYGHRPMYCSSYHNECNDTRVPHRQGDQLPEPGLGVEPLLKEFGVDLVIFGHEHSYERLWPVYDHKVYNGSGQPYHNPRYRPYRAPVHLVTGSAGCAEETYEIVQKKKFTAFASSDYGYTKFKAYNKTHIYMEQVSVDQKGQVIDKFMLVKDQHKPYDDI